MPQVEIGLGLRDLLDDLARLHLVRMEGDVGLRDDADQLAALDDRKPPDLMPGEEGKSLVEALVGRDGRNVARRHVSDCGVVRVAALDQHADDEVSVRDDADEPAAVDYRDRADVLAGHHLRHFEDRRGRRAAGRVLGHEVSDLSHVSSLARSYGRYPPEPVENPV